MEAIIIDQDIGSNVQRGGGYSRVYKYVCTGQVHVSYNKNWSSTSDKGEELIIHEVDVCDGESCKPKKTTLSKKVEKAVKAFMKKQKIDPSE